MSFDYDFRMQIDAPRPVVFERLLRIEHLSRWFCGWCRIDPKVGGAFKFGGETCIILPEQRSWETTIEEGEVLRRFAFTWPIQSSKTRVSYDLEDAAGDKALLRVRHLGVPFEDTTCGSVQDAWRMCLEPEVHRGGPDRQRAAGSLPRDRARPAPDGPDRSEAVGGVRRVRRPDPARPLVHGRSASRHCNGGTAAGRDLFVRLECRAHPCDGVEDGPAYRASLAPAHLRSRHQVRLRGEGQRHGHLFLPDGIR